MNFRVKFYHNESSILKRLLHNQEKYLDIQPKIQFTWLYFRETHNVRPITRASL